MKYPISRVSIVAATVVLMIMVLTTSCIKDEPLNAECDIERVVLHGENLETVLFQMSDTARAVLSTDSILSFRVRNSADLSALSLTMTLTPGATVQPALDVPQDFSAGPVCYTVTSQDGRWHRRYWIDFERTIVAVSDTMKIDFEDFGLEPVSNSYYIWRQDRGDGVLRTDWASGNSGYKLSKRDAMPEEYPTVADPNGYDGNCLHLITLDTGPFGRAINKPIAAGNLFFGEFDVTVAVRDPMRSTRFGLPFNRKPLRYTGYYKYKAGSIFKDRKNNEVDRVDNGSIYAVFYRNHDADGNPVMLFGDDVQTNPHIVGIAKVPDIHQTDQWTPFDVTFNYYEEVDMELLANYGYSLTIVFSSSVDGDVFEGAIGSELFVDKVRLVSTHNE